MSDADARRWSEPSAEAARRTVISALGGHGFEWERVARCGEHQKIWEIAIRLDNSDAPIVFRISGSRATELRMLAVGTTVSPSCGPEDLSRGLAGVGDELPW